MKNIAAALALIACVAPVLLSGCDAITGVSNVTYEVTGTARRVDLTYETEGGGTAQRSATLPWTYTFQAKDGDFLYVSAQITDTAGGTVTVVIKVGGDTKESASSSGFAHIATASMLKGD